MTAQRSMLVVVAHPDDETFGTGSVIAFAAGAGWRVTVCCATRGEAGEARGVPDGADLGMVREAELRAAGAVLGVRVIVLLDFRDSGMSGPADHDTLCGAPYDAVVAEVARTVDEVRPELVVTLDPDHGDGHRDHVRIARATLDACRSRPAVRVYAWAIRRALLARWFAEIEKARPGGGHLDLDREQLGRMEADITTVLEVADLRPLRERAIALHASQVSPYEGMPADLRDAFLNSDSLVRLQPSWTGGSLERELP